MHPDGLDRITADDATAFADRAIERDIAAALAHERGLRQERLAASTLYDPAARTVQATPINPPTRKCAGGTTDPPAQTTTPRRST